MTDFARLGEWIHDNYDVENYSNVQDLIEDVKIDFVISGSHFPRTAEDKIYELWDNVYNPRATDVYGEDITQFARRPEIEDVPIGMLVADERSYYEARGLSDEILDSFRRAEFLGIDVEGLATRKEYVEAPDIRGLERYPSGSAISRVKGFFRKIFRI